MAIYAVLGFAVVGDTADLATINTYLETLGTNFTISPMMLIPPLCVLLMVVFKVPAIPGLLGVAALGGKSLPPCSRVPV